MHLACSELFHRVEQAPKNSALSVCLSFCLCVNMCLSLSTALSLVPFPFSLTLFDCLSVCPSHSKTKRVKTKHTNIFLCRVYQGRRAGGRVGSPGATSNGMEANTRTKQ